MAQCETNENTQLAITTKGFSAVCSVRLILAIYHFIFDDDHGAVGYLKLNTADAQSENTFKDALEIERIYIRHAFQNQGLGEILYNLAKTKATLLGKKQVWLGVWEYNQTAITFYQHYGFEFAGSRTVHLGDAPQIDLLMVKHL
ncbi:GNAT family N-acetyltransferase [Lentilactobacillus parafarraginis]